VREAVTTAQMARELFGTPWIKLEIIRDDDTLCPDVVALVEAARILSDDGFQVFPYCTEDLSVCGRLLDAGCQVLMPWGAPIGSGRGLNNVYGLRSLRAHFPMCRWSSMPGSACPAMPRRRWNWAMTPCLLNTAVAKAGDPVAMARAMALAIEAGRAGPCRQPDRGARHGRALDPGLRHGGWDKGG
jgi:thiazole synthase